MVKLEEKKFYTEHCRIEKLPQPNKVYIPLSQHIGCVASPLVKPGDQVFPGQKIAGSDALVSACVHASIPGKVSAIVNWPHPVLGICKAIVID
ncbi:MAG: electron transporter RnfC, partial [Candidatus Omnitrophota bacterium]